MSFHWHTDENERLDQPAPPTTETKPLWGWLLGGTAVLLLAAYAWWGLGRWETHAADREAAIKQDVAGSYTLLRRAATAGDVELMRDLVSSADMSWAGTQARLLTKGHLLDRAFPTWHTAADEEITITPTPDFRTAAVTVTQTYTAVHTADPIRLQQTLTFRPGTMRWQYTAPPPDFWGETMTGEGDLVRLTYPQRDTADARQLLDRLETDIGRYCERAACPHLDQKLRIHLQADPDEISDLYRAETAILRQNRWQNGITLPTISLIGRPVDTAAREALLDQYVMFVLSGLNNATVFKRPGHEPFDRALFAAQMKTLGLPGYIQPDPNRPFRDQLIDYEDLWWALSLPPGPDDVYTQDAAHVIRFLQYQAPGVSLFEIQRLLADAVSYRAWIETITQLPFRVVEQAWDDYISAEHNPMNTLILSAPSQKNQPPLPAFSPWLFTSLPTLTGSNSLDFTVTETNLQLTAYG